MATAADPRGDEGDVSPQLLKNMKLLRPIIYLYITLFEDVVYAPPPMFPAQSYMSLSHPLWGENKHCKIAAAKLEKTSGTMPESCCFIREIKKAVDELLYFLKE